MWDRARWLVVVLVCSLVTASPALAHLHGTRTLVQHPARLAAQRQLKLARIAIWHGSTTLRWLRRHPSVGARHERAIIRRNHLWLYRYGLREQREALERLHPKPVLTSAWACIHSREGSWTDPGGPYYGGLQMDVSFQIHYGREFFNRWGTADRWPIWAQIAAAERARRDVGYSPWPNTARACGLL